MSANGSAPSLLTLSKNLECATDASSASELLHNYKNINLPNKKLPNEWFGTGNTPSLHAATLDIVLNTLANTSKKYPELSHQVEQTVLQWNYCEVLLDESFYDFHMESAGEKRYIADQHSPANWQGFHAYGFLGEHVDRIKISEYGKKIDRFSYSEIIFSKLFRQQCLPHPETSELYYDINTYFPGRISHKTYEQSSGYPHSWEAGCASDHVEEPVKIEVPIELSSQQSHSNIPQINVTNHTPTVHTPIPHNVGEAAQEKPIYTQHYDGQGLEQDTFQEPQAPQPTLDAVQPQPVETAPIEQIDDAVGQEIDDQPIWNNGVPDHIGTPKPVVPADVAVATDLLQGQPVPAVVPAPVPSIQQNATPVQADLSVVKKVIPPPTTLPVIVPEGGQAPVVVVDFGLNPGPSASDDQGENDGTSSPKKRRNFGFNGFFTLGNRSLEADVFSLTAGVSYKPIKDSYWFARSSVSYSADTDEVGYTWGIGYDDWHPGTIAFQLNHWGPLNLDDGLDIDNAVASVSYKFKKNKFMTDNGISSALSLSQIISGKPVLSWSNSIAFRNKWFFRTSLNQPLNGDDLGWTYGFGRSDYAPFTWSFEYNNWGFNRAFQLNAKENANLSLNYRWSF